MPPTLNEDLLDDLPAMELLDASGMLRAVASSAAQIRMSRTACTDAGLDAAEVARPRALVVIGMGGSAIAGDVLAAAIGPGCPVPIVVHRSSVLPAWVGAADLVVAVSCSGSTAETLAATDEAVRRGCELVGVGRADSPLARRCEQARAHFVAVTQQLAPRSSLWALATPLLVLAQRMGITDIDDAALEAAAVRLEQVAETCRPDRELFVNPAKELAVSLAGGLPMVWGAGAVGPVAAQRFVAQLAENAKRPAVAGALPEAHHNQVVTLDGSAAGGSSNDDLFRDRVDEDALARLQLVLLLDDDGEGTARRAVEASERLAEDRGVVVRRIDAEGPGPVERLAGLIGLLDHVSVYLALASGVDPTPIAPIDELKRLLA